MKKVLVLLAVATMAISVSAQTVTESKTFDNFYIGLQGGVSTRTLHNSWLNNLNPNAGLRIGRYFTPVFGLAAEGNAYLGWRGKGVHNIYSTAVKTVNVNLLGTVNLSNWFGGYKGEPRAFEVSGLYGFGWLHGCGTESERGGADPFNGMTSKAAIDFAFNLGAAKAVQLFIEPSINWDMSEGTFKYNLNRSWVQLNAGIVYKFKNSNGTHNFTIAQLRDQAEIDALNAEINRLRNQPAKVVEKIVEVPAKEVVKEVKVEDLVFVTFAQAKYNLTADAKKALDNIAEGSHVQIVGTASPEGNPEKNLILSQNRANAVADYLRGRGVIVDEATGKGVQGTTSNRLAVVYVK